MVDGFQTHICKTLQGFQQVRRLHDEIILTLALVARLTIQGNERFYIFYV